MAVYKSEKEFLQALKRYNAISSRKYEWYTNISEKEHQCEFGHTIPPENLYFKKPLDMDGEQKIRVCKACMEKLVFMTVDSDLHAKELTDHLYHEQHPRLAKTAKVLH